MELPRSKNRRIGKWEYRKECGKEFASFYNGKTWSIYCSKHCSSKNKSQHLRKRKTKKYFCDCGKEKNRRAVRCRACDNRLRLEQGIIKFGEYTIEEQTAKESRSRHAYQRIRNYAREFILILGYEKKCRSCGYSKHVELCHIKAISEFPKETKIKEVNSLDNLIYLCPNCHWELDNGILSLAGITQW